MLSHTTQLTSALGRPRPLSSSQDVPPSVGTPTSVLSRLSFFLPRPRPRPEITFPHTLVKSSHQTHRVSNVLAASRVLSTQERLQAFRTREPVALSSVTFLTWDQGAGGWLLKVQVWGGGAGMQGRKETAVGGNTGVNILNVFSCRSPDLAYSLKCPRPMAPPWSPSSVTKPSQRLPSPRLCPHMRARRGCERL